MDLLISCLLFGLGGLGYYTKTLADKPAAEEMMAGVRPAHHILGAVSIFVGALGMLEALSWIAHIGAMGIWWLVYVGSCAACILVGFVASYDMLQEKLLSHNPKMYESAAKFRAAINIEAQLLDYICFALGGILLVLHLLYRF